MKAVCIALVLCIVCLFAVSTIAEDILAVVVDIEKIDTLWCVNCLTADGNLWSFFDEEDYWQEGDKLILIFEDEEIVSVR